MGRRGDTGTRRRGETEVGGMGRRGDTETRRRGDAETRRWGNRQWFHHSKEQVGV
ncbi:hypothetical protein [Okeania sp. SIO3B5]|uniref:hypothetical protein n=1 Tax=Okeania sp. SIO3B5 TaxID=2607811 RepID=UPI0025EB0347|nr:hypothetical protein [Okeania sp. SIO3B5]